MPTRKFQKGDTVRCVDSSNSLGLLVLGQLYLYPVGNATRYSGGFELVRPVGGFQIGDVVAPSRGLPWTLRTPLEVRNAECHFKELGLRFIERPEPDPHIAPAFQHLADWLKFRPGDIAEYIGNPAQKPYEGTLCTVAGTVGVQGLVFAGGRDLWPSRYFRLVSRPGADGWVAWFGEATLMPGKRVRIAWGDGVEKTYEAGEFLNWHLVRGYKVVEEPKSAAWTETDASRRDKAYTYPRGWVMGPRGNDLRRDKAYRAWLDEGFDDRLRSAFEAGWKARGWE